MLAIYEDAALYEGEAGVAALENIVARHTAFASELGKRLVAGEGLDGPGTATTVRTSGGRATIHDGPFAEAKEQLGGFYIVDVPDLDAALEIARKVPLGADGAVEIRPILDLDDAGGA
jgi:hypothetical protein